MDMAYSERFFSGWVQIVYILPTNITCNESRHHFLPSLTKQILVNTHRKLSIQWRTAAHLSHYHDGHISKLEGQLKSTGGLLFAPNRRSPTTRSSTFITNSKHCPYTVSNPLYQYAREGHRFLEWGSKLHCSREKEVENP